MGPKHISLAGTATLGPKGQVVIPAEVREKMNIAPGDKLIALYVEEKNSIAFVTESSAQEIINKLGEHVNVLQEIINTK